MGDRQTDKTSRWAFTAYEDQWPLFSIEKLDPLIVYCKYQEEVCPETGRRHYQGALRTGRQVRFSQLVKLLPGVHIEVAKNWDALLRYVEKSDTAVSGTRQEINRKVLTMSDALVRLASVKEEIEIPKHWDDCPDRDKRIEKARSDDFWERVNQLLLEDSNLVGLYTQPQYFRAWMHTWPVWFAKSIETDRQTDTPEEA